MDAPSGLLALFASPKRGVGALLQCNERSRRYGLTLSEEAALRLCEARESALREAGRVEFGEGILPKLISAFCGSPFILQDEYEDTLAALQELFYRFKNETRDRLSDDDLISAMETLFNGKAGGSVDYLAEVSPAVLMNGGQPFSGAEEEEDGE